MKKFKNWGAKSKALFVLFLILLVMSLIKRPVCYFPEKEIQTRQPTKSDIVHKQDLLLEEPVIAQYHIGMSMGDYIKPGMVCLCGVQESYGTNDVVSFWTEFNDEVLFVVHRIVNVTPEGFIMKGDANSINDPFVVPEENVFCKIKEHSLLESAIINLFNGGGGR